MGVEKIQYKNEFLSEENIRENINTLWGKALPILMHRKYLYDRFTRKYDKKDVVVALEYYIGRLTSVFSCWRTKFSVNAPLYSLNTLSPMRIWSDGVCVSAPKRPISSKYSLNASMSA